MDTRAGSRELVVPRRAIAAACDCTTCMFALKFLAQLECLTSKPQINNHAASLARARAPHRRAWHYRGTLRYTRFETAALGTGTLARLCS